jgi:Transmembrane protein 43
LGPRSRNLALIPAVGWGFRQNDSVSNDSFTTTTSTSWFSRMGKALGGIIIGLVLVVASIGTLAWNEGRAVKTSRALKEGASIVINAEGNQINPALNGKLIHFSGDITVDGQPTDDQLKITTPGIRLARTVEMFQWSERTKTETKKKIGGGEETTTTYTYVQEWSASANDSSQFQKPSGHENPRLPITSDTFSVASGKIGAYSVTGDQLGSFGTAEQFPIGVEQLEGARAFFGSSRTVYSLDGTISAPLGDTTITTETPRETQIGDVKVSYTVTPPGPASVVAKQVDTGVGSYETKNGRNLFLTANGSVDAASMFATAKKNNEILTWVLRAAFLLLLFVGFKAILGIAGVMADVLPFMGSIVRFGTSIVALILALAVGSLTIAIAWFAFRPLISAAVISVAALVAIAATKLAPKKNSLAVATERN